MGIVAGGHVSKAEPETCPTSCHLETHRAFSLCEGRLTSTSSSGLSHTTPQMEGEYRKVSPYFPTASTISTPTNIITAIPPPYFSIFKFFIELLYKTKSSCLIPGLRAPLQELYCSFSLTQTIVQTGMWQEGSPSALQRPCRQDGNTSRKPSLPFTSRKPVCFLSSKRFKAVDNNTGKC